MDKQIHHIKKQVIEIRLKDVNKITETREKISSVYNTEVLKILNEVFDDYFASDRLVIFDKLELDLGTIKEQEIENELPAKIKEKIKELLEVRMKKLPSSGEFQMVTPTGKIIKSAESDNSELFRKKVLNKEEFTLKAVSYYFKTGVIPWYAAGEIENMESELMSLILKAPEKTRKMFSENLSSENVRDRIAKEFSLNIIIKIAGLYNPDSDHIIRSWAKTINKISEKYIANRAEIIFVNYFLRLAVAELIGDKIIRRLNDRVLLHYFVKILMNKASNPRAVIRHLYFAITALGEESSSFPITELLFRKLNNILSRKGIDTAPIMDENIM